MYGFENDEFKKRQDELQKMKFEMDGLQKSFGEMPGMKLGTYDVTGRDNPNPNTTLGTYDLTGNKNKNSDTTLGVTDFSSAFKIGGDSPSIAGGNSDGDSGGGMGGNAYSAIGAIAGSIGDGLKSSAKNEFMNNNYVDEQEVKEESREKTVGSVKDGVASAVGPFGQLFRGIEKMGGGIGDSIGGESGAVVSSIFSPDEAIMANNSDPDVSGTDKVIGTILPMYAAVSSERAKRRRKRKFEKQQFKAEQAVLEQEYRMEEGKDSLESLSRLRKAQMNYLI